MAKIICGPALRRSRKKLIGQLTDVSVTDFIYIVPTYQLQLEVEKEFVRQMREKNKHQDCLVYARPKICLFSQFIKDVLKDWGLYQPPLANYQQLLVLKELIQQLNQNNQLSELEPLVGFDGFYQSILDWIQEMQAANISEQDWFARAGLSKKEEELGLIYATYENYLERANLVDENGLYRRVLSSLRTEVPVQLGRLLTTNEQVIIDGFYRLNSLQLNLISALLGEKKDVIIHTYYQSERESVFPASKELLQRLEGLACSPKWTVEKEGELNPDPSLPVLKHLCNNIFNLDAPLISGGDSIQILETPDAYHEVQEMGRQIRALFAKEEQLAPHEIGIIFRNIGQYHFYIEQVFSELKIPYQITGTAGVELDRTPLFRLIRQIYQVILADWPREGVVAVLKSPYLYFREKKSMELFEKITYNAGIIGGERHWQRRLEQFKKRLEIELKHQNERKDQEAFQQLADFQEVVLELAQALKKLNTEQTIQDHCQALLDFFKKYQLDQQILLSDQASILRRDLLSLEQLQVLLQEIVAFQHVTSDQKKLIPLLTTQEFLQILQQAAREVQIPEPSTPNSAVQILTSSQSRGKVFKYVLIGGLVEGQFPWYSRRDWLLSPDERRKLGTEGLQLRQFSERMEEERLFFVEALSTAVEKIFLTIPVLPNDDRAQRSPFIQEVLNLFDDGTIKVINTTLRDTEKQANGSIALDLTVNELEEVLLTELWQEDEWKLLNRLSHQLDDNKKAELKELWQRGEMIQLRQGDSFSIYDGLLQQLGITNKLKKHFHQDQVYSISQINEYALCPFHFFSKRILALEELSEPILRLEALNLGNLYHDILFRFFRQFPGWKEETLARAVKRVKSISEDVFSSYIPGFHLPAGLWKIYQEEIVENLERVLHYEYSAAEEQDYRLQPFQLETSFGLQKEYQEMGARNYVDPVVVYHPENAEEVVRFRGKIDRIDRSDAGEMVIYDYKLGSRDGLKDIKKGLDLQLPIYIKAVRQIFGENQEILGAGYFSLLQCDRKAGIWRDRDKSLTPLGSRARSFVDDSEWEETLLEADNYIFHYLEQIRSGNYSVNPGKTCPEYCPFKKICRFDPIRIQRKLFVEKEEGTV